MKEAGVTSVVRWFKECGKEVTLQEVAAKVSFP